MAFVRQFEPEDLLLLEPRAAQQRDIPRDQRLEFGHQFREGGSCYTWWGETPEGTRPLFCGGHLRRHRDYAALWGMFSVHCPAVPLFLTRTIRRYVAGLAERRVEAQVASSNTGACGWARLIGLEEECRLRAAMPDGSDMIVFVKQGLN